MTPFKVEHLKHHKHKEYFAKNWMKALSALIAAVVVFSIASLFMKYDYALTFSLGFIFGYISYEYFHRSFHINAPSTKLGAKLRKHHFYHHFSNPNMNHGVTTTFWDKIFKTYYYPKQVNVHQRFAMNWLIEAPDKYNRDYIIKSKTAYT